MELAQRGDVAGLRILLESHATDFGALARAVNAQDDRGFTALHHASYFDEGDCVEALLASGACNLEVATARNCTALHTACVSGSPRAVELILAHCQAHCPGVLDQQNSWGETALHLSAGAGLDKIIRALLDAGASAAIEDKWGRTAVSVSQEHGCRGALAAFREAGIEVVDTARTDGAGSVADASPSPAAQPLQGALIAEFMSRLEMPAAAAARVEPVVRGIFRSSATDAPREGQGDRALEPAGDSTVEPAGDPARDPSGEAAGYPAREATGASAPTALSAAELAAPAVVAPFAAPRPASLSLPVVPPTTRSSSPPTTALPARRALSKLVEFPGDPHAVAALLRDATVDPAGKVWRFCSSCCVLPAATSSTL